MKHPAAVLWDVDGTLAETERDGHRVAFNQAFAAMGLDWRWDEAHYGRLLAVPGGRERLLHDMALRPDAPASQEERDALARYLHALKNGLYARLVAVAGIALRPGVEALMQECLDAGVPMGIATTTSHANLEALLEQALGSAWRAGFAVCVCGEDVQAKKPDPEVYQQALRALQLRARDVIAIEDSPAGVQAAVAAGVPVAVTRSVYFADAPVPGALAVGPGLHTRDGWSPSPAPACRVADGVGLRDLTYWMARIAS